MIGIDVLCREKREADGQSKATWGAQAPQTKTPTFLLELPLVVEAGQAARLRAHLEAGRQFYNAVLSAGQRRLRQMRADPAWQVARAIPKHTHTGTQSGLLGLAGALRLLRVRLSRAGERAACLVAGRAPGCGAGPDARHPRLPRAQPRLRGQSPPRALQEPGPRARSSIENKRNDTGLRFVLQTPEEGTQWLSDLARRPAAAPSSIGTTRWSPMGWRTGSSMPAWCAALPAVHARKAPTERESATSCNWLLEGVPYHKPKHVVGTDTVGAGPGAFQHRHRAAGRRGPARAARVQELRPDARAIRRLQRQMERQRRAANPEQLRRAGSAHRKRGKGKLRAGTEPRLPGQQAAQRRPASAGWRPTARACMAGWPTRSWRWATPSSPRRFPIKAGRNGTARAWDFVLQGCS